MGRTSKTFASLLILLFVLSLVTFQPLTVKAQNKTITVPDDYPTIQWAIDNSNVGDTIFVKNGIYSESITINKAIRVLGESTENTIINGTKIVITINSNDVFLDGFTIVCWNKWTEQYGDRVEYHDAFHLSTGISLKGSNSTVSNNIIVNAKSGISQLSASKNNLINNIIIDSSCGISLSLSKETKILSNIFSDSETAISLDASSNNRIFNNTIINQLQDSIRLSSQSNYNEIQANNISNIGGYSINIDNSSKNSILKNNIWDCNRSAIILGSENYANSIISNFITSTKFYNWSHNGIEMWYTSNNNISANYITNLDGAGIMGINITNCQIMGNKLTNSGCGISLIYSMDNRIYSNEIANNTETFLFESEIYRFNYIKNESIIVTAQIPAYASLPNASIPEVNIDNLKNLESSNNGNLPLVVFLSSISLVAAFLFFLYIRRRKTTNIFAD